MRPALPSTRHALLVVALLGLVAFAGCGKSDAPTQYDSYMPADLNEPPKTPMQLTLVSTIEAGVKSLRAIAIDRHDRLYAMGTGGVRILSPDGAELAAWTPKEEAWAIAADDCGTVYLGFATRLARFDLTGKELGGWPIPAAESGKPARITAVALAGDSVLIADAGNLCVHRYATNGDFVTDIGKRDDATDFVGLIAPSPLMDVALDNESRILVTNPGRLRVETYTLAGRLVRAWGLPGLAPDRFQGCCNPTNVACTREGFIVTSEKGIPRVKVSDGGGNLLAYLGPAGIGAKEPGLDLAVDSRNRIYVAAAESGRILVFELTRAKETP